MIKQRNVLGVLFVLVGAILFSAKAIFVKAGFIYYQTDVITLLMLRMLFSLPFYLIAAYLSHQRSAARIQGKEWLSLIMLGFIGYYLSSLFDFMGLQYVSAGLERLILFIYPTMVVVFSAILYKTPIKKREYFALFLTYAGIILAVSTDISGEQKDVLKGSLLVLACALTYAFYLIGSGRLIPRIGSIKFTAYVMIISTFIVIIHFFAIHSLSDLVLPYQIYLICAGMAIISTVLPSFLLSEGIKLIGSGKSSIIGSVGPVSTILLAYIFLGEIITFYQILGTALVLGGVLLVSKDKTPVKAEGN